METNTGVLYGLEASIKTKLIAQGAISEEKAVTIKQANFDMQERNWMAYIAGGMFATIKKTGNGRFYVHSKSNSV